MSQKSNGKIRSRWLYKLFCAYMSVYVYVCVCACLCGEECYSTNDISYNSNIPCQKMSVHKVPNFCHVTNVSFTDQDYRI